MDSLIENPNNLALKFFQERLLDSPNKTFIHYESCNYSFVDIFQQANNLAKLLKKIGLQFQDRVSVSYTNSIDFVIAYFAVLLSDGVAVTVSPLLTKSEKEKIYEHAGICLSLGLNSEAQEITLKELQTGDVSLKKTLPISDLPIDLAVLIYTSGTTGSPKGVMLTYSNILAQCKAASKALKLTAKDKLAGVLSLSHVFGQMDVLWAALSVGATVCLLSVFDARSLVSLLNEEKISLLIAVPTMYQLLLRTLENGNPGFPSLRVCHSGAAPMPAEVYKQLELAFAVPVQEGYGLTETCSMAFSNPLDSTRKMQSVGKPIEGVELLLRDEAGLALSSNQIGEVCIRGLIISAGYFKAHELTKQAFDDQGWLLTGDLGYKDEDGFLFLVDRKKDLIIRAGHKVYPREVEEVLLKHPLIAQVAVVGISHALQGQKVKAFLVPKTSLSEAEQKILIAELRELSLKELAKFKIPSTFSFLAELPKTPSGKILKRQLISSNDWLAETT
jgi:long-chain acyl-CoA synthetase